MVGFNVIPADAVCPLSEPRGTINRARATQVYFLLLKLNFAFLFGLILVFVLLLINALLAQRQSREKLLLANEQLQQYALRLKDQGNQTIRA